MRHEVIQAMNPTHEERPFDLDDAIALLRATPSTLRDLLEGLPDSWVKSSEPAEDWSPYTVLLHLVQAERTNWIPRARIVLSDAEDRKFAPFNQLPEDVGIEARPLASLLAEFIELRADSLASLSDFNLQPHDYEREAEHPVIGPVTLRHLLATWVVHDLNHTHQIVKALAKQYIEAVGPWKRYLAILDG
jgi:hypothetical protein